MEDAGAQPICKGPTFEWLIVQLARLAVSRQPPDFAPPLWAIDIPYAKSIRQESAGSGALTHSQLGGNLLAHPGRWNEILRGSCSVSRAAHGIGGR